jgi:hypothetical protein
MATVVKDFKVKAGLVVEGSNATVNGNQILREDDSDQYIIDLIGGETLVTSVDATQLEVVDGELAVKANVFDDFGSADDAETAANSYTDGRETAITTAYESYADTAEADAITSANGYTDTALEDYTTTANLDTAIGGYGYLKDADLPTMYSDADAVDAVSAVLGEGIEFVDGSFDVQIATGLVLGGGTGNQIEIDRTTVDTWYDAAGDADAAETAANEYTDLLLGDATIDGSGGNTVTDRIATAVADLVDGAPALLDTLNELAAAIGDSVDGAGLATAIGNKLPLAGGTMTGAIAMGTNKITGLGTPTANTDAATKAYVDDQTTTDVAEGTNLYFTNQRALDATSAAYDISGAAATAEQNAKDYADDEINALTTSDIEEGTNLYFTNQRAIDAVGGTIGDQIDLLDTDDIEEGSTNLYYTDARAKAEASALLTNATKTNITITADGSNNLTITAENGVADSDTDDLDEGTSNLYFTNVRAVDALEAVVPNFTAVEVNSLAKQIAATVSAPTGGSQVTAYAFAKAEYRSAKFLVKTAYATHTELSEVLITLDTSDNIAITEYAIVGTNGSSSTITADVDGANVRLRVTPTNNTSTVTVVGTLLA